MTSTESPGRCPRCHTTVNLYRDVHPKRTGGFEATCANCGEQWRLHRTLSSKSEAERVRKRKGET